MLMPSVSRYMSTHPFTIDRLATLSAAHQLMVQHGIRHLPVVDQGAVCGIVSQRDLYLLGQAIGMDPEATLVHAAMTDHPCVVTSDTPVDEAAAIMAEHKYGSVIVVGHAGVEGIFTATDACRALCDVLQRATA